MIARLIFVAAIAAMFGAFVLRPRRPGIAALFQVAGVEAFVELFFRVGWAVWLVAAAAAAIILVWTVVVSTGGRRLRLSLGFTVVVLAGVVIADAVPALRDDALAARVVIGDHWPDDDDLHVTGAVALLDRMHMMRCLDWSRPLVLDRTGAPGGPERALVLENAGPAESWSLIEGAAVLEAAGDSGVRISLPAGDALRRVALFPRLGSAARPVTTVAFVSASGATPAATAAAVRSATAAGADAVVVLAGPDGLAAHADFLSLLVWRQQLDDAGARLIVIPGDGDEHARLGWRCFESLFGPRDATHAIGSVVVARRAMEDGLVHIRVDTVGANALIVAGAGIRAGRDNIIGGPAAVYDVAPTAAPEDATVDGVRRLGVAPAATEVLLLGARTDGGPAAVVRVPVAGGSVSLTQQVLARCALPLALMQEEPELCVTLALAAAAAVAALAAMAWPRRRALAEPAAGTAL